MVDLSRRSFLRGALTVAAVAAAAPVLSKLPEPAAAGQYPILYGDGVHDDAPALNAMFNGKTFICENEVITVGPNSCAKLKNGTYLIKSPIIAGHPQISIENAVFIFDSDCGNAPLFTFKCCDNYRLSKIARSNSYDYRFQSNRINRPTRAIGGNW